MSNFSLKNTHHMAVNKPNRQLSKQSWSLFSTAICHPPGSILGGTISALCMNLCGRLVFLGSYLGTDTPSLACCDPLDWALTSSHVGRVIYLFIFCIGGVGGGGVDLQRCAPWINNREAVSTISGLYLKGTLPISKTCHHWLPSPQKCWIRSFQHKHKLEN